MNIDHRVSENLPMTPYAFKVSSPRSRIATSSPRSHVSAYPVPKGHILVSAYPVLIGDILVSAYPVPIGHILVSAYPANLGNSFKVVGYSAVKPNVQSIKLN